MAPDAVEASIFRHRDLAIALIAAPLLALAPDSPALRPALVALGAAVALGGLSLRLWAIRHIGRSARTQSLHARRLLVEGPFHAVRNPIYVGNLGILSGLALVAGPLEYALAASVLGAVVYGAVVRAEEGDLQRTFGADYRAYRLAVGRFVPRLSRLERARLFPPGERVPWTEVLGREMGAAALVPAAVAIAALKPRLLDLARRLLPSPAEPFVGPVLVALVIAAAGISAARAAAKGQVRAVRRAARAASAAGAAGAA